MNLDTAAGGVGSLAGETRCGSMKLGDRWRGQPDPPPPPPPAEAAPAAAAAAESDGDGDAELDRMEAMYEARIAAMEVEHAAALAERDALIASQSAAMTGLQAEIDRLTNEVVGAHLGTIAALERDLEGLRERLRRPKARSPAPVTQQLMQQLRGAIDMTHPEAHHEHMEDHHLAPLPPKKKRATMAAQMLGDAHRAKSEALKAGSGSLNHCVTSFMTSLSPSLAAVRRGPAPSSSVSPPLGEAPAEQ